MVFEKIETQNFTKQEKSLDEQWFERFQETACFGDFENLEGKKEIRAKEKEAFLKEQKRNPKLDYPKLEKFDFEGIEKDLIVLKEEIKQSEQSEIVWKAYLWKINEKLAQLRMLKACKDGNDYKVGKYSKFIYGEPSEEVFQGELSQLARMVYEKETDSDLRVLLANARLKEAIPSLGEISKAGEAKNLIKKTLLKTAEEEHESTYDAEMIAEIFDWALKNRNLDGWKVVIEKEFAKSGISVSQEKKQVKIPENRKMSPAKLHALIEHEIDTHVMRRKNGEHSRLKLLGLGLDRYISGEEGVSTFAEQQITGAEDYAGFDGHLAISLAMGLDGQKRDFRQVFNILRDYFFIKSKNQDKDKAWELAKNNAWNRCIRTFRGTTCSTPGVCLTRDIVYREGNIRTWRIYKDNPNSVKEFSIGKYDPGNARHLWLLEKAGILDESLEELEK